MSLTGLRGGSGGMGQLHHHGKPWMFGVTKLKNLEYAWTSPSQRRLSIPHEQSYMVMHGNTWGPHVEPGRQWG